MVSHRVSTDVLGKTGINYVSFISHSNQTLSVDLERWLLDTQQEVSGWIEDMVRNYLNYHEIYPNISPQKDSTNHG